MRKKRPNKDSIEELDKSFNGKLKNNEMEL